MDLQEYFLINLRTDLKIFCKFHYFPDTFTVVFRQTLKSLLIFSVLYLLSSYLRVRYNYDEKSSSLLVVKLVPTIPI